MSTDRLTFIYTNSHDQTTDLLISKLGADKIFRFNFNLWREYKIHMDGEGFRIESPTGRCIDSRSIAKGYWRKPMRWKQLFPQIAVTDELHYIEEELWYAMRELINLLWLNEKLVLVEPFGDLRSGKFVQGWIAKRYFTVPPYKFVSRSPESFKSNTQSVVKSLTSARVRDGGVFYTTRVAEDELDPSVPWMIQELVEAEKDVTVAFVRDKLFSFELPRNNFLDRTVDWREVAWEAISDEWPVHPLPAEIERNIFRFMRDMGLQYGRIDLLYRKGTYYFLEVNPNGEWGWLDVDGTHGLLGKIIEEISPDTPAHPLPFTRAVSPG